MIFTFALEGDIAPKSRSRIATRCNRQQAYSDWINGATDSIVYQRANKEGYDRELIMPCSIEILLVNPSKMQTLTVLQESIMHALVKSKLLRKDSISSINSISIICVNIPTGVTETIIEIADSSQQKEGDATPPLT